MNDDELIYYAVIALNLSVKKAREMVANRKERIEHVLALYFALKEANQDA